MLILHVYVELLNLLFIFCFLFTDQSMSKILKISEE